LALLALVAGTLVAAAPTAANSVRAARSSTATFQPGDVFAISGPHNNSIDWRHSDGSLVVTLDPQFTGITPGGFQDPAGWIGGMAFDPTGRLAVSGRADNTVVRFAPDGSFLGTFIAKVGSTDAAPCPQPSDISYGREGDLVVGDFGFCDVSANGAEWFDRNGVFKALVWAPEADTVDLDADQCTLFFSADEFEAAAAWNICTGQFGGFGAGLYGVGTVRVLPDGSVLVGGTAYDPNTGATLNSDAVQHFSRGGTLLGSYPNACGGRVVLDVGGTAFWNYCGGGTNILIDVATGSVLRTINISGGIAAVYGGFRSALAPRSNRPPDCTTVKANASTLSPPDHKYQIVSFSGAVDPDNNPVTLIVIGAAQDEPISGTGPGDVAPDAKRSTVGAILLRSEAAPSGDGRVYRVTLRGSDGKGGSCTTTVSVGVPLTAGATAVDSGGSYNSFGP
jgi:hypothetical protein